MAIGDVLSVRLSGSYLGETWLNQWWYQVAATGPGNSANYMWQVFDDVILPPLADFFTTDVTINTLQVINYNTPTDWIESPPNITAGQRTGTGGNSPSFLAAGVRFNRFGPGTRYAYKRFVGLSEGDVNNNALEAATVALLTTAAAQQVNPHFDSGWQFTPVQVRHPAILGTNPTVNFQITAVLAYYLSTQNTRKV